MKKLLACALATVALIPATAVAQGGGQQHGHGHGDEYANALSAFASDARSFSPFTDGGLPLDVNR